MKQPMITTAIRLPQEMIDWLGEQGQAQDRDKSYVLRAIIRTEMDRSAPKRRVRK